MGIMGIIKTAKDKFYERRANRLKTEVERIKIQKERESKLASASKEYLKEKAELEKLQKINQKASGPSTLQRLSSGLAKMQNKKSAKGMKKEIPIHGSNIDYGVSSSPFSSPFGEKKRGKGPFNF